jgi:hypothetical protein
MDRDVESVSGKAMYCDEKPSGSNDGPGAQRRPRAILHKLFALGHVEERGIEPVPLADRNSTRYFNIFTIWFSMNTNILA